MTTEPNNLNRPGEIVTELSDPGPSSPREHAELAGLWADQILSYRDQFNGAEPIMVVIANSLQAIAHAQAALAADAVTYDVQVVDSDGAPIS